MAVHSFVSIARAFEACTHNKGTQMIAQAKMYASIHNITHMPQVPKSHKMTRILESPSVKMHLLLSHQKFVDLNMMSVTNALKTALIKEANIMNPDQTAPKGAV